MKALTIFLAFAGLLIGILAAYYWWMASRVQPPALPGGRDIGIDIGANHDWLKDVESAFNASGRLNSLAAALSGAAVILSSAASLVGLLI